MKTIIFSLLTVMVLPAFGAADACGTHLVKGHAVGNQNTTAVCSSFATAQVLNAGYPSGTDISPNILAVETGSFSYNEPEKVLQAIGKKAFLCLANPEIEPATGDIEDLCRSLSKLKTESSNAARVLNAHLKSISEDKKQAKAAAKVVSKFGSLQAYAEIKQGQAQQITSEGLDQVQAHARKMFSGFIDKEFLNAKSLEFAVQKAFNDLDVSSGTCAKMVKELYEPYCRKNSVASKHYGATYEHTDDPTTKQCAKILDQELSAGRPTLIHINNSIFFADPKSQPNRQGGHYVSVVGLKCGADGKRQYIVRNSYGSNCVHHKDPTRKVTWECSGGDSLIDEDFLCGSITETYALRPASGTPKSQESASHSMGLSESTRE